MKQEKKTFLNIVGIDEVGRGPIAGPLTVGAFMTTDSILKKHFRGVKESKQLTEEKREVWFEKILALQKDQKVNFSLTSISAPTLDKIGISKALKKAISLCLKKLNAHPEQTRVLLDGGIYAPREFLYQETIIKGDEKKIVIALASIVAKVTRDREMVRLSARFPQYLFHLHKGYGTKEHYARIKKYGLSPLHRRSFLKGFREE